MAVSMRSASSVRASGRTASRARAVVVRCQQGESSLLQKVQIAAASFAVASSLLAAPANAGVVLEQPKIKKLFQDDTPAAPAPVSREIPTLKGKASAPAAAAAAPAAPKPKVESEGEGSELDPRSVALPGSLIFVTGAYFALTKLDVGFADWFYNRAVRDSTELGVGFEPAIKSPDGPQLGTKKVKASKKK